MTDMGIDFGICLLKRDFQMPNRTTHNKRRRKDFGTVVWHSDGLHKPKTECGIMLNLCICASHCISI